jgi:hypothetical protein
MLRLREADLHRDRDRPEFSTAMGAPPVHVPIPSPSVIEKLAADLIRRERQQSSDATIVAVPTERPSTSPA